MRKIQLTLLMVVALAACRSFQNPDAQVIDLDRKIEAIADGTTFLLQDQIIKPDEAEAVHAALTVAKKHNDRARAVLLKAKQEGRPATEIELREARGIYQLALDALGVAAERLREYERRKESR